MRYDQTTDRFIASLLESSPAPIVAVDRNKLVTAWNPAATQLFGWEAESVETSHDKERGRVVITVSDEGVGIADADLTQIMDPFYTTKRESGGTGLGLSIASRIARDHNGILDFKSTLGEGTVARLTLPVETAIGEEEI